MSDSSAVFDDSGVISPQLATKLKTSLNRNNDSLDFDMMRTKIMTDRETKRESLTLWLTHILCGFLMGTLAFLMNVC